MPPRRPGSSVRCFFCGAPGHVVRNCDKRQRVQKCTLCNGWGHHPQNCANNFDSSQPKSGLRQQPDLELHSGQKVAKFLPVVESLPARLRSSVDNIPASVVCQPSMDPCTLQELETAVSSSLSSHDRNQLFQTLLEFPDIIHNRSYKTTKSTYVIWPPIFSNLASPDLKPLAKDHEVVSKICKYIEQGSAFDDSGLKTQQTDIVDDWREKNVPYKRSLVQDIVTVNGSQKPNWGKEDCKPFWWPTSIPFIGPNNNRTDSRLKVNDLDSIIQAFIDSRPVSSPKPPVNETMDIDDGDDDEDNDDGNDSDDGMGGLAPSGESWKLIDSVKQIGYKPSKGSISNAVMF
eukprot:gene14694-biopygen11792